MQVVLYDRPVLGRHFYSLQIIPVPPGTDATFHSSCNPHGKATVLVSDFFLNEL